MTEITLDPSQDWEALYNMREWLSDAIKKAGGKVTGGGCGCGQADLDIELEGFGYDISIKPVLKSSNT